MKLKTLEISGFKSFANRTKIDFMPGITGVVGPNGSGKSNIIEAIRWVMGETSAKGLRGDKMVDVIFGGTDLRAPLNRAEVIITFDNTDHYLNSDFNEIQIARTLYRNGESKYQLNGKVVRLRDIHELFMDSGLGRESFSIISQGRVERIFSAKPEERRSIIEDVAGVFKYKQSKEKAEKELTTTVGNLQRVQDILYELEGRVEPLAEQAARAQDYVNAKNEYDRLDQMRLVVELTDAYSQQATVSQQVQMAEAASQRENAQLAEQMQTLNHFKVERADLENQRDHFNQKILTLTQQVERLTGEQKLAVERAANRSSVSQDLHQQMSRVNKRLAELTSHRVARQAEMTQATEQLETLQSELTKQAEQHPRQKLTLNEEAITDIRNQLVDAMQALTSAKNEQAYLAKTYQQNDAAANRLAIRLSSLNEKRVTQTAMIEELTQKKTVIDDRLTMIQNELLQQQAAGQTLTAQHKEARTIWLDALANVEKVTSRLQALQRVANNYDGFYQGVKHLMNAKSQFAGIRGVVAELISVEQNYALAIETALGGALQQVVVDQEATAQAAIKYLTQHRLGRVTFLPLSTIKARQLPPTQLQQMQQLPGFIGVASTLVTTEPAYTDIISNLLGVTVIVDNLDHAVQIGQAMQHRVRLVTLDGQVMNTGGSMTGGAARNSGNGLLSQQTELESLEKTLAASKRSATQLEAKVQDLDAQLTRATEAYTTQQNLVVSVTSEAQQIAADLSLAGNTLAQTEREYEALNYELRQSTNGSESHEAEVADNAATLANAQVTVDQLQGQLDTLNDERAVLITHVNEADNHLTELKTQVAGLTANREALQVRYQDVLEQIASEETRLADLQSQLASLNTNSSDVQAKLQQQLTAVEEELTTAQTRLEVVQTQLTTMTEQITVMEVQVTSAQANQRETLTSLNDLSARQAEVRTQIQQMERALSENYALTYEAAQAGQTSVDLAALRTQLKLLKLTLADIGTVNLAAIDEYTEVKARYDFLTQQQTDLLAAQANLRETMSEMDAEVEMRFKTTFDHIATHFATIFQKMFGGGQAVLELTDPDQLLATGVDIKAQPPGKKFQQMSLLSGGEKALTAISLLFAILEVRPVPFAVLDETEAALDEANVDRFAHYLHEVNDRTQFIVITHRKGTMVNADVLYGVTMQEPGVSTMVSVNLENYVATT